MNIAVLLFILPGGVQLLAPGVIAESFAFYGNFEKQITYTSAVL